MLTGLASKMSSASSTTKRVLLKNYGFAKNTSANKFFMSQNKIQKVALTSQSGFLRNFSKSKTSEYRSKYKDLFKIEADPNMYVDINTNMFQQKIWADKLNIPEEFVFSYFGAIKRVRDTNQSSVTSFDPKNFTKETPKSVVREYLSIVQSDLVETYQKYQDTGALDLQTFLEQEGIKVATKEQNMPQFAGYTQSQLTESEKLEVENEKDVFRKKLTIDEQALVDKIIGDFAKTSGSNNPLQNPVDTYNRSSLSQEKSDVLDYIRADRTLKDDFEIEVEDLLQIENLKYHGLQEMHQQQSPEYQKERSENISMTNMINNSLRDKILLKREILKKKLKMLEEINQVYQTKTQDTSESAHTVTTTGKVDLLAKYEKNLNSQNKRSQRAYKGKNKDLLEMENIILKLENGDKSSNLHEEYAEIEQRTDNSFNDVSRYYTIKMRFGIATNNSNYVVENLEKAIKASYIEDADGNINSYIPISYPLFKSTYDLCLRKDNFRGLGKLINYAEKSKLNIAALDLSVFKSSLEYYLNHNSKLTNLLVFTRYYTKVHKDILINNRLTPEKLRKMTPSQLEPTAKKIFHQNNLIDMKDLFEYLVRRVGTNRIVDKESKQEVMDELTNYFIDNTTPFMDFAEYTNNFVRENDIAKYLSNRFDEANSFDRVVDSAIKFGDRTLFHEFIGEQLQKYQHKNNNKLPDSYSKQNVLRKIDELNAKVKSGELPKVNEMIWDSIILPVMKHHKMIDEMKKIDSSAKNHFLTDAICRLKSDGSADFYSSQVKALFKAEGQGEGQLYTLSMIKALLKEGDMDAALRLIEQSDHNETQKKKNTDLQYLQVYSE